MDPHDDRACDLCGLDDLTLVTPRKHPQNPDCDPSPTAPDQHSLFERLADMRTSVSELEWHYIQLVSAGRVPSSITSTHGSAAQTLSGIIAALGQVRQALDDAHSALSAARSRSSRLRCIRDTRSG